MNITSTVFQNNESLDSKYSYDGDNVNPPLTFSEIPQEAASLALIMDDPDAPSGTFTHWILFNLSPSTLQILEGQMPETGILGKNDYGEVAYGGPKPPSGTHRYFFKLYALDAELNLEQGATRADVDAVISEHIIDSAEIIGLYTALEQT